MFAETYIPPLWIMASTDINQDVGDNEGRVAGVIHEGGNDRPINIYNHAGEHDRQPPIRPQRSQSADDRLDRLELYMYGDGISMPGVLRQQAEIIRQQADIIERMSSMMFWLWTVTGSMIMLIVVGIINMVIK